MRVERRQLERDDAQRDRTTQVATMASSARQALRKPGCVQTLSNTEAAQGVCKRYPTRKPPITSGLRQLSGPRELPALVAAGPAAGPRPSPGCAPQDRSVPGAVGLVTDLSGKDVPSMI